MPRVLPNEFAKNFQDYFSAEHQRTAASVFCDTSVRKSDMRKVKLNSGCYVDV